MTLDLPTGTHAAILRDMDIVTGGALAYPVVWADRPYARCPRCHQPIRQQPDCPAVLNAGAGRGGAIEPVDQRHGCGAWLAVAWQALDAAATPAAILAVARDLADDRLEEMRLEREAARVALDADLQRALDRLAEPLEAGETSEEREEEVTTGSLEYPGVYRTGGGRWTAWVPDPCGDDEPIEATETTTTPERGNDNGAQR